MFNLSETQRRSTGSLSGTYTMWLGCKFIFTFLSATGSEMRDTPSVKTLSRWRMGKTVEGSGGAALLRQEGQSEEVMGRTTRNQPCEMPGAGKGQAGVRNHKKGSLELARGASRS